ncbi:MAG: hypothetical protein WHS88_03415 [Anaerohalosphaeraceae bacterium]
MADVELFGLHPAGHHLASLLLHLLTAAAYAAVGDFSQAAAAARQARHLAQQEKNTTLLSQIDARLQLYQQGKSFLEKVCGQEVE